jgi:uncharacterized FlaG/YvyC family protein
METQEKLEKKAKELNEIDKKIKEKLDKLKSKIEIFGFNIFYRRDDDAISAKCKGQDNGHILQVKIGIKYDSKDKKFVADVVDNNTYDLRGVPPAEAIDRFENIAQVIKNNSI